ncbi:MAG: hypothetical protein UR26_C0003G0069 [candidate division TM6 bacterium GW2011_GWF2_32_72]|nr:MAG: hypothetical protein UR26_C0003G0069 [candidate division TM6 bacterium GW2011_GWF2_32_72]
MHKRITFRGMEHSPVMEKHVDQQLEKILHILDNKPGPKHLDVVLDASKIHCDNKVECTLKTPQFDLISHHSCPDIYEAINISIDILYHQLLEAKRKLVDDRKQLGRHEEFKKER